MKEKFTVFLKKFDYPYNIKREPLPTDKVSSWELLYYKNQDKLAKCKDVEFCDTDFDYILKLITDSSGFYFELQNSKTNQVTAFQRRYFFSTYVRTCLTALLFALQLIQKEIDQQPFNINIQCENVQLKFQFETYISRYISQNKLDPNKNNSRQNLDLIIQIILFQQAKFNFSLLESIPDNFETRLNVDAQNRSNQYIDCFVKLPRNFQYCQKVKEEYEQSKQQNVKATTKNNQAVTNDELNGGEAISALQIQEKNANTSQALNKQDNKDISNEKQSESHQIDKKQIINNESNQIQSAFLQKLSVNNSNQNHEKQNNTVTYDEQPVFAKQFVVRQDLSQQQILQIKQFLVLSSEQFEWQE